MPDKIQSKETPPSSRDIERVLDQIDFTELAKIYREIGIKSGVREEDIAPVTRESIAVVTPESAASLLEYFVPGWCSENGEIALQSVAISRRSRGLTLKYPAPIAATTLNMLCHEEAHGSAYRGKLNRRTGIKIGLHNSPPNTEKYPNGTYVLINEAVTDIIGKRAFVEYLNRRRIVDVRDKKREISASDWRDSYPLAHWVFDALTARISQEFQVPPDVIENAFIRGAFEGANLSSDEISGLLKGSVSEDFYENIKTAATFIVGQGMSATIDFAKVATELKSHEWSESLREKWRRLLGL